MWQGLGDLINTLRYKMLGLSKLSLREGPSLLNRSMIPWTYCWSQSLIPKPKDWKKRVDIAGFYFLPGSTDFQPGADLVEFLRSGPPPMYIGCVEVRVPN
jgi:sterol 3beta-glucosyltransferase